MKKLKECVSSLEGLDYLYNHLDRLNPLHPIGEQLFDLGEDLFQARFGDGTIVDVGCYPWAPDGVLRISVIRNENWDTPIKQMECKEISDLYILLTKTLVEVNAQSISRESSR